MIDSLSIDAGLAVREYSFVRTCSAGTLSLSRADHDDLIRVHWAVVAALRPVVVALQQATSSEVHEL